MAIKDFIGRGWLFPLRFSPSSGGVAKDRGEGSQQRLNRIRMSLQQIIGVKRGEMFMQRKFGSGVRGLIFQMDTFNLKQRVEFAVTRAINDRQFGEKRIFLNQMAISVDRATAIANIIMNVVLRSSNVAGNLVLPFYTSDADRDSVNQILSE